MAPHIFQRFLSGLIILLLIVSQLVYGQNNTECHSGLGCFDNGYPWSSIERPCPPPKDPKDINTAVYCYTRNSTEEYQIILWPDIDLNGCPFDPSKMLHIVVHGYMESGKTSPWMDALKDNLLAEDDATVMKVDWGDGSLNNSYLQAMSNTRIVGAEISRLINYLKEKFGLLRDKLHLIGFSLGCHIMGYASRGSGKPKWISGLDCAQPGFEGYNKKVCLTKNDADHVLALHCNGSPFLTTGGFGFIRPLAHQDVYVNNGFFQPGCQIPQIPKISSLSEIGAATGKALRDAVTCSHVTCPWVYTKAVHNCEITAQKVNNFSAIMIENGVWPYTLMTDGNCTSETCLLVGLQAFSSPVRGILHATTTDKPDNCSSFQAW